MRQKILFSDIDGCLIDGPSPNFAAIRMAFERLKRAKIDVILSTAKTAHELMALNQYWCLPGPFIVENGAGVLMSASRGNLFASYTKQPMQQYVLLHLVKKIHTPSAIFALFPNESFLTQMSVAELSNCCDLSFEEAQLARMRDFSEPMYIENKNRAQRSELKKILKAHDFYHTQSHRFLYVYLTSKVHKAIAIHWILANFYASKPVTTFAIGDSLNDFSMLNACDYGYYIMNRPTQRRLHWQMIAQHGFLGWQQAVDHMVALE